MNARLFLLVVILCTLGACSGPCSRPSTGVRVGSRGGLSTASVYNGSGKLAVVYVAFGSDSVIQPANWSFCTSTSALNCSFNLAPNATQALPLSGNYLNASIAFDGPVGCGNTKAELNLNNPSWYDIADVSLVDGHSNEVAIDVVSVTGMDGGSAFLGPPNGASGNERVLGVFPLGCDICTGRQHPPCGIEPGGAGCKSGTQYKPDVICQFQGATKGGGSGVTVRLLAGIPMK